MYILPHQFFLRRRRKRENFESLRSLSYSMQDISLPAHHHHSLLVGLDTTFPRTGTPPPPSPALGSRTGSPRPPSPTGGSPSTGPLAGCGGASLALSSRTGTPEAPVYRTGTPEEHAQTLNNNEIGRSPNVWSCNIGDEIVRRPLDEDQTGQQIFSGNVLTIPVGEFGEGDSLDSGDGERGYMAAANSASGARVVVHTDSFFGRDLSKLKIALSNHRDVIRPRNVKKRSRKL